MSATVEDVLAGLADFAVVCGDATTVMEALPEGCAHVTYCDPPYGLSAQSTENIVECLTAWLAGKVYTHKAKGFMGSSWDSYTPGPEAWRAVHRALRPGGYCVAFSSTRTVDLLGIAIRLAGFEQRNGWAWVQGQSFPKNHDVSKAIDNAEGAEREVLSERETGWSGTLGGSSAMSGLTSPDVRRVTAATSPGAVQWDGYGTDVKQSYEPLVVARKALDGTVAHNVTTHGCGALNIDAARIGTADIGAARADNREDRAMWRMPGGSSGSGATSTKGRFPASLALVHDEGCVCDGTRRVSGNAPFGPTKVVIGDGIASGVRGEGRPALPHADHADPDGMETVDAWHCTPTCAVAELGRQSGVSASSDRPRNNSARPVSCAKGAEADHITAGHSDTGTAARFFYQAKASSRDRLAFITCTVGCAYHETVDGVREARLSARDPSREHPHGFCRACGAPRDHYQHPTVKPLDLARYHARLLSLPAHTQPIALVPFCGTGIEARALLEVGFRVIAIDLDPRHCAMTAHRLGGAAERPQAAAPTPRLAPVVELPRQPGLFDRVS